MGWNSYNPLGGMHGTPADADPGLPGGVALCERLILETADALVDTGLRDAGYEYLNIDDRWQDPREPRGADGRLRPDPRRFPRGIRPVADEVHGRGLKFGLYTVANVLACGGEEGDGPGGVPRTGSLGHEGLDAATFADWGVDFLKIDWCGADSAGNRGRAAELFARWNRAIKMTGRPMVLSASTWGEEEEDTWAPELSHLWRTTGDLHPTWSSILSVAHATASARWSGLCGPKRGWNDPDMLQVGHPALTYEEARTHMVLWAMLAAPLLAGNDVRRMPDAIHRLLLWREVIAIDQDPFPPAVLLTSDDGWDVWSRPLSDGTCATALVNREDADRALPAELNLPGLDRLGEGDRVRVPTHGVWLTVGPSIAARACAAPLIVSGAPCSGLGLRAQDKEEQ